MDRKPNPNGSLYLDINTISTHSVSEMLHDLVQKKELFEDASHQSLIVDTYDILKAGLFDDSYGNIFCVAPELKVEFIYKESGHIRVSKDEKNTGDAFKSCLYGKNTLYRSIAFVPGANKVIMVSKCQVSMKLDDKTRGKSDIGETQKRDYLLVMELLFYKPSDQI